MTHFLDFDNLAEWDGTTTFSGGICKGEYCLDAKGGRVSLEFCIRPEAFGREELLTSGSAGCFLTQGLVCTGILKTRTMRDQGTQTGELSEAFKAVGRGVPGDARASELSTEMPSDYATRAGEESSDSEIDYSQIDLGQRAGALHQGDRQWEGASAGGFGANGAPPVARFQGFSTNNSLFSAPREPVVDSAGSTPSGRKPMPCPKGPTGGTVCVIDHSCSETTSRTAIWGKGPD